MKYEAKNLFRHTNIHVSHCILFRIWLENAIREEETEHQRTEKEYPMVTDSYTQADNNE
jgi:hypothetical protein